MIVAAKCRSRALSLWGVRPPVPIFVAFWCSSAQRTVLCCIFFALSVAALGQTARTPADFEGRRIARIDFDPRDQPLPREEMERLLAFKSGTALKLADVHKSIQNLYQTGRFANIAISAQASEASDDASTKRSSISNAVVVIVSTEFNYFVGRVTISSVSEPPNKGQLNTAAKLELGAPFDPNDMEQAVQNMQERMRANGLYHADINYSVDHDSTTEEVAINFDIDPGKRARFDGVNLSGTFTQSNDKIIKATRWRRGFGWFTFPGWREVTESRVNSGVNNVRQDLQKGDHLQALVSLEKLDYHTETNMVTPTLSIESGPILQVRTSGAKVSKGKLRQLIPIFQERAVDRTLLLEGQRNLTDFFQSQGYFDAAVDYSEDAPKPDVAVIDYNIDRGQRYTLHQIKITGNNYFDQGTLLERLQIRTSTFPRYRFGRYSQKLLDRDKDSLRDLYRSNGFHDVQIESQVEENFQGKNGNLAVVLEVKEGPQWFVGKLEIEGPEESELSYLRSLLQSTEGQPFSEADIAADRESVLSYYYNSGYADATFEWTQTPGDAPTHVNLKYVIHPGKRVYVRGVLIRGLETTKASLVDNRISLQSGDPLSQISVSGSQQKLYDLGIFSKVQTAIQNPDGEEDQKYVLFNMDEASRYSFTLGFGAQLARIGGGVTTYDNPAGSTGFSPRVSIGISRINFLGLAHTISLQTLFSTVEQRAVLTYLAPQFLGQPRLSLTISGLFDNAFDVRTFHQERAEGSIQLAQRISRQYMMQYRYTFRHVAISDLKITPGLVPLLSQPDRTGIVSMTFIQDRRDDPINSHKGIYNTVDAGWSARGLGSSTDFTRLLLRNSTYHPVGRDMVFARSLQFGYIQRLGGLAEIPLPERFFSGGASSNRAFPDNQAGPRDLDTGFPLGGSALLMFSEELRFPLIGDNLGGVLFHDWGNVYDDIKHVSMRWRQRNLQDFNYGVQSFGFGIRYRTPIGPIRADFSLSPNSPRFYGFQGTYDQLINGQGIQTNQRINVFQFHFSLGQTY